MANHPLNLPMSPLILLTGATGYVGGRLLPHLERRGRRVRCLARRPEFLASRVAPTTMEIESAAFGEQISEGAQPRAHHCHVA